MKKIFRQAVTAPLIALSLAGGIMSSSAMANTPVFSAIGTLSPNDGSHVGPIDVDTYTFNLTNLAPSYVATLSDSGVFGSNFIGMALFSQSAIDLGGILAPGSFSFMASELGTYTIMVAGKASKPYKLDFYGVNVTAVPEVGVWAMLLVGLGLIVLRLQDKPW